MQYEKLLDGNQIPVLGLGTWRMGGSMDPEYDQDDFFVQQIKRSIDMGYTHIDTAEAYGGNHTEELVGQAIQDTPRENLFITTKVWRTNLHYNDVHRALEGSLKRLQTDYVDLYLIHWPNPDIPLSETFRALNELQANGKVRYLGVSNFDVPLLKEAMSLANTPIVNNQVKYNLNHREPEQNGVLEFCRQQGITLTAWSPLKDDVLSHSTVKAVAAEAGGSVGQVALHWLMRQPAVITIPKASSTAHLQDNLAAVDLTLSDEAIARLNAIA